MRHRLIIRPEAEADIETSFDWYENESGGLGTEFLSELRTSQTLIDRNPLAYPVVYRNIRRALFNRFPHALFYICKDDIIVVVACVHHKRDPKVWKSRR